MSSGPLNISIDLTGVKTEIPAPAEKVWVRQKLVAVSTNSTEKGNVLKLEWHFLDLTPRFGGGEPIKPGELGSKFFENIQMYSKPDSKDPDWWKKRIAERIDALLGTGDEGNAAGKPARPTAFNEGDLINRECYALYKMETGEYAGAKISSLRHPSEMPQA